MPPTRRSSLGVALAGVAVALVALPACGGGGGGSSTTIAGICAWPSAMNASRRPCPQTRS